MEMLMAYLKNYHVLLTPVNSTVAVTKIELPVMNATAQYTFYPGY